MSAAQEQTPSEAALKLAALQQRYSEEAAKRYRSDGLAQFVQLQHAEDDRLRALGDDPWADHAALNAANPVQDGTTYKYLILGTGYGGLLIAVRLIQHGAATADDIRFVDTAGGFGGTWYWNRYPGLHCDVESYTYMPLLEETGYVPTHKYASGVELREHADRIASQWNLTDKALFRTQVKASSWDDSTQLWTTEVTEGRGPSAEPVSRKIRSEYIIQAPGVLSKPQLARIPGLETFGGELLHTARWDYGVSGGSPENQVLTGFEGKRVGIIGTGATAVQVVPSVAKYAKEFYVFQRTPSSVNWRGQKPTDPEEFRTKIAHGKGWQLERMANLARYNANAPRPDDVNLVNDAWTELTSYCAIVGSPTWGIIEPTPEKIGEHLGRLLAMDVPHAERIRARVDEIVKDPDTASKLKGWYPTWCKRPTFSDLYLQAFNQPNVHLVDTDGKGVTAITKDGAVVGDKEYPLDVIILATGYRTPAEGGGSPAVRAAIDISGRGGKSLHEKWETQGASTLHGVTSNSFPNLFFASPSQSAATGNFVMALEVTFAHVAHIIAEAERRAGAGKRAIVEAAVEAEEAFAGEIMRRAAFFSTVTVCTPGYLTSEGEFSKHAQDPAHMMKAARAGLWTEGMQAWMDHLQAWRDEGTLQGLTVETVPAL
ncbi:pyridine nucleotide-disulfide oxidoreductase-like protein [Thozetella sp. PMI_491]|nr:pyridine nucleotide-disulfide oxidoreductase-like protein [Thozetella sp. PMI_491]